MTKRGVTIWIHSGLDLVFHEIVEDSNPQSNSQENNRFPQFGFLEVSDAYFAMKGVGGREMDQLPVWNSASHNSYAVREV